MNPMSCIDSLSTELKGVLRNYLLSRSTPAPITNADRRAPEPNSVVLDFGIDMNVFATTSGLMVGNRVIAPEVRRLHHLLSGTDGPHAYLADEKAIRSSCDCGDDPVLYRAYRDVLPPRDPGCDGPESLILEQAGAADAEQNRWYADLVVYSPGVLPDGEPIRSFGHWNAPGQLEAFQTITGRTLMITAGRTTDDRSFACYQICESGDVAIVPLGAWHLTYCLEGPAAVFNIYSDLTDGSQTSGHSSRQAALDDKLKYRSGPPVRIAMRRASPEIQFVVSPGVLVVTSPSALRTTEWTPFIRDGQSLVEFYLNGSGDAFSALAEAICSATVSMDRAMAGSLADRSLT